MTAREAVRELEHALDEHARLTALLDQVLERIREARNRVLEIESAEHGEAA